MIAVPAAISFNGNTVGFFLFLHFQKMNSIPIKGCVFT